ncbi:MAG: BREX-2 system adenine-specific DNA-methyltransferase PglX [Polyangiaceae bacterium]
MALPSLKKRLQSLEPQPNPQAELDSPLFLAAATPVLKQLFDDLLKRADESKAVTLALKARHAEEKRAERTADGFPQWRRHFVDQVAAAWLLSCVFVRTLEDRGLGERARLAGPGALDSERQFQQLAPSLTARDYLLFVFRELSHFPAVKDLFDQRHNPVWLLAPSAEAAKKLLDLFRSADPEAPAFRFGQPDSRFLGDLYQDLNEGVKARYALLQTPRFVERFILERTLDPAIERFGLEETSLIDPTCGSGHFLLGAFEKLFDAWLIKEPNLDARQAAAKALDQVYGSDINPYAVAIARLRLTLAFLEKAQFTRLKDAPNPDVRLVVADSLLYNPQLEQTKFEDLETEQVAQWSGDMLSLEDPVAARKVLHRQYTAVVGNPPYITVKDAKLRDRYRAMYVSTFREYSLAAPFAERFFQLAKPEGHVGMITANSFMKREFGKKLIQEYLPTVNLSLIVNTAGAYIPGHGTPTVLLFGTHAPPSGSEVDVVLANRGEPTTPADPEHGEVWSSIYAHWMEDGFENDYVSVARAPRDVLSKHPWSLSGGGATELKTLLEARATSKLSDIAEEIGFVCITRADDIYFSTRDALRRAGLSETHIIDNVEGEFVRDWSVQNPRQAAFPYDSPNTVTQDPSVLRFLWPYRTLLWLRREPNGDHRQLGRTWWEWSRFQSARYEAPLKITFPFVATHNHFVLDRGGRVFNRTAPIIKLPAEATEDDHLALLAYLNSSVACFWMKQVFFDKGNRGEGGGLTAEAWEKFYEFDGTKLKLLPVPKLSNEQRRLAVGLARRLLGAADERAALADWSGFLADGADDQAGQGASKRVAAIREAECRIRAIQEELDWFFYRVFALVNDTPSIAASLEPGERASDVLFADAVCNGAIGERYFELCRLPKPNAVKDFDTSTVVASALNLIKGNKHLQILETPVFKRTFREGFRSAELSDAKDSRFLAELETLLARETVAHTLTELNASQPLDTSAAHGRRKKVERECAAFLAAHRFTDSGLEKYAQWEHTWDLQRREDRGETVGEIPVPPKYDQKSYRDANYWRLRGKLDVPKERFISYPGCESDTNGEPVYGWAGWNHEQRAAALSALYISRRDDEGWTKERLTPLLAGLLELLPWLQQWHSEVNPEFGQSAADEFSSFLEAECRNWGLTHKDLRDWRPATKAENAAKKRAAKAAKPKPAKPPKEPKQPQKPRGKAKAKAEPADLPSIPESAAD